MGLWEKWSLLSRQGRVYSIRKCSRDLSCGDSRLPESKVGLGGVRQGRLVKSCVDAVSILNGSSLRIVLSGTFRDVTSAV